MARRTATTDTARATIPRLSGRLRRNIEGLVRNRDALVEETLTALVEEIPDYRKLADPEMFGEVRTVIARNADLWYRALLDRRLPSKGLEEVGEFARRRARQGFPLDALLRAYRVGARVFWRTVIEGRSSRDT